MSIVQHSPVISAEPNTVFGASSGAGDVCVHRPMLNAFTVDLEDWAQGLLGGETPITHRVIKNTSRMLKLLERHQIRATFFALGKVCEQFPELLPRIKAAGHEIASHGYGHDLVFRLSPTQFRDDLKRSIDVIVAQTGERPLGYRAPAFSITQRSLWAGEIIESEGFKYSSSVFPFEGPRYGIAQAPRFPFRWFEDRLGEGHSDSDLLEFPLTTLQVAHTRWPVAGGGYLRLLPVCFLAHAVRQANRHRQPAVVYMHPYEMDPTEVGELRRSGWPISAYVGFKQSLFRSFIRGRLATLFQRFRFAPMRDVLSIKA